MKKTLSIFIICSLFTVCSFAKTDDSYQVKFWLWPQSMQVQVINPHSGASTLVFLKYDPLKMFLYEYEINHAGFDQRLAQIQSLEDIKRLRLFYNYKTVEYIQINGERFGALDENFVSRSVFGSPDKEIMSRVSQMQRQQADVFMINHLFERLFRADFYLNAKDVTSVFCGRFLN